MSKDSMNDNIVKKWVMRQYWRVQQSQAFISMGFWGTTLTLLIWPYVGWRFSPDCDARGCFPDTLLGLPATYFGLAFIFIMVMTAVLLFGIIYDTFLGLWVEWRSVDIERNPYATYALSPNWMMTTAIMAETLKRVSTEDEKMEEQCDWILNWCKSQAREEMFARTVQKWDKMFDEKTPTFWFLDEKLMENARNLKFDDED